MSILKTFFFKFLVGTMVDTIFTAELQSSNPGGAGGLLS